MFAAVALTQPASVNVNSVAVVVRLLDTPLHITVNEDTGGRNTLPLRLVSCMDTRIFGGIHK